MTRLDFVPGCQVPPVTDQLEVLASLVGVVLAVPLPLRVVGISV